MEKNISYQKRFERIKKLISKIFPDLEVKYRFNRITKYFEVIYYHSNNAYVVSILKDSTWVHIKNIY